MNTAKIREALETAITIAAGALGNQSAIYQMEQALAKLDDYGNELDRLREAIRQMECSCLPHADEYPENKCDRCRALEAGWPTF